MTPREQAAVQEVVAADEMRTMVVGTTTSGGFGVPFELDPTITLLGAGALNPVREFATVRTIATDQLKLVSSDGVVAAYAAELTEASDNSPTLAQPVVDTAKGQAFIPYSIEVGMDYPNLVQELAGLLADARAVVDATQFLSGSGTDSPEGVLTGLSSTSWRVQTATVAVTAISDIYSLKQAVPARFFPNNLVHGRGRRPGDHRPGRVAAAGQSRGGQACACAVRGEQAGARARRRQASGVMLVARRSFSYTDSFDGKRKAVHRGRTRISADDELARRFPLRFGPVNMREEAASRFRHVLDQADTYDEYRSALDALTARLELVERMGEARCGRESTTHLLP